MNDQAVFANHASTEFNTNLANILRDLTADVAFALSGNLIALILGGGYGRGEGGVSTINGCETPYNDLDLSIVVYRKNAVLLSTLEPIREKYSNRLQIHVDFSRPLTRKDLRRLPHCLMWKELLEGHQTLYGPLDLLATTVPSCFEENLPLIEATRLLLNRGAGLLWSLRIIRGAEETPDKDFIPRNYQKCVLALGDALAIACKRHQTPYTGRDIVVTELLQDIEELKNLGLETAYREALEFKFRPKTYEVNPYTEQDLLALAEKWGHVFLYVEKLRTGKNWKSLNEYVRWSGTREHEQNRFQDMPRNLIKNLKEGRFSLRYPREILFRKLPSLLGLTRNSYEPWSEHSRYFMQLWERYN